MFSYQLDTNLRLELLTRQHAPELYNAVNENRQHLSPWMPWVATTQSVADVESFIATTRQQMAENNGFQTAIRAGQEIVGVIGMHKIDWPNRSTSLGYWLAEKHQGQGIMTKACSAYITHAFTELDLHRLEIRCATENTRSRAIPQRLGFTQEGTIRSAESIDGRYLDHVVYGLLASEWQARQA
ncbi:RimJ/RimL family protein N-acetyltransferase [Blastopirellula marina]|uniref:RimJ/RimL family protein N-acetyltransferase n=1 Tax=Blastopirellula marina TaxID=124 RepID=A0A2S8F1M5_9BACT|nr:MULTISPECIES: GNAT family protein [Pirellulaceae]PQO26071.1 RimJ/RimL family protein N-acetyltransferase [Blastopirellula marina]RCS44429.1 N-acetyltransferase [Bremerella cremea]